MQKSSLCSRSRITRQRTNEPASTRDHTTLQRSRLVARFDRSPLELAAGRSSDGTFLHQQNFIDPQTTNVDNPLTDDADEPVRRTRISWLGDEHDTIGRSHATSPKRYDPAASDARHIVQGPLQVLGMILATVNDDDV